MSTVQEPKTVVGSSYNLFKATVLGFIDDEALTRGAAISFYTVTAVAPLLLILVGLVGLVFGREAAQGALVGQFSGLLGADTADFFQTIVANAAGKSSGTFATIAGFATLLITATGVFSEMQSALNTIWKVETKAATVSRLLRARAASMGLVAVLGFLLVVSLVVSAVLTAFSSYLEAAFPVGRFAIYALNHAVSFLLIAVLFAAIFKVLPDRKLEWRDVAMAALATSLLFSVGKYLIAWYLGTSGVASTYGAAGALILLLLWVYYSVQILLMGAEFTKAYANARGSRRTNPVLTKKVVDLGGVR